MTSPPPSTKSPEQPAIAYRTTPPGLAVSVWRICRIAIFGYDIFLSHSHCDAEGRAYALALWPRLEELGLTTCFDATDFHPGERLEVRIKRAVTDSRALILLDSRHARTRPYIRKEVACAVGNRLDIIVVRPEGVPQSDWPGIDSPDPLIRIPEPAAAFTGGQPSHDVAPRIRASFRWTRVRTRFFIGTAAIALLLVAGAAWIGVASAFSVKVGGLYATMHDRRTPIDRIDAGLDGLRSSWVLGSFGRLVQKDELDRLAEQISRLHLKPVATPPGEFLRRAGFEHAPFRLPFAESARVAAGADKAVGSLTDERSFTKLWEVRPPAPLPVPPFTSRWILRARGSPCFPRRGCSSGSMDGVRAGLSPLN